MKGTRKIKAIIRTTVTAIAMAGVIATCKSAYTPQRNTNQPVIRITAGR